MEILVCTHSQAVASNKSKLVISSLEPPQNRSQALNWISYCWSMQRSSPIFIRAHIHPSQHKGGVRKSGCQPWRAWHSQQKVVIRVVDGKRQFKWQLLWQSQPYQHLQVRRKGPEQNTDFPFVETKVRMLPSFLSNLIPITSPPQQGFQAGRYSFPFPLCEM